MQMNQSLLQ
jgi:hypothetical protein